MDTVTEYRHIQRSPIYLVIYAIGLLSIGLVLYLEPSPAKYAPLVGGAVATIVGTSFHYLRVQDEGDFLRVGFGPLPLFQRKVWYHDIRQVEVGRTLILDGLGIHMSMRGGWVWNIWGRDCVVIHFDKSVLRVGTDDAENLRAFIDSKITTREDLVSPRV